jgi:hypothetical protein
MPFVYRYLSFRSLRTAERAARAISHSAQANKISRWTRALIFEGPSEPLDEAPSEPVDAFSEFAATIVAHVRQPVNLYLEGSAASGSRLAATIVVVAATISTLTLDFGPNANSVFARIGCFVNVHTLTLVGTLDWNGHWPLMRTSGWEPWTSSSLVNFSLQLNAMHSYGHARAILGFVRKCEMANLAEFRLSWPWGFGESEAFHNWEGFVPELSMWQNCSRLMLCGIVASSVVTVEVLPYMAYPTIELDVDELSDAVASALPKQVRTVVLVGTSDPYAMARSLVVFLDAILYRDEESQLAHIRLEFALDHSMGGHAFVWRGGHPGLDRCIAQLIPYEIRLREQRILVVDSNNDTRN